MMHLWIPIFLIELQKVEKADYYLQCSSLNQIWTNKSELWAPAWFSTGLGANQLWQNAEHKISEIDPCSLSCYSQEEAKIKLGTTTAAPFILTGSSYHSRVRIAPYLALYRKKPLSLIAFFLCVPHSLRGGKKPKHQKQLCVLTPLSNLGKLDIDFSFPGR